MEKGFITIHRSIQDKGYYTDSEYVHLWVHILMRCNHKPKEHLWNGSIIHIERGQFITGRNVLARETGINSSKVERILKVFESEHQIEQQKTNKFRLITVKNYDKFQLGEQQNEQQVNNKRTTNEQQVNTNNKLNTLNNDNNLGASPQKSMGNIRIEDDEITYVDEFADKTPKKYINKKQLYKKIALNYMARRNLTGDVLRYYKDIKELVELTVEALKQDEIQVNDENVFRSIMVRFDAADKYFDGVEWGINGLIKHFNKVIHGKR